MGGLVGCGIIPAGGTYAIRLFLPHWATFKEAGSYTINVTRTLMVSAYIQGSPQSTLHADVSAKIKVAAEDSEQVGALIESLGASMLERNNKTNIEAASMLEHINDQRTIQYFATALRQYGAEPEWSDEHTIVSKAAGALSRFEDDRAIAALEKLISSTQERTRLNIADALSATNHPRGVDLLLAMKNDSYWFVRLRVAQRLAKVDSEKSVSILRAMLVDENEDVRTAARDSLKALRKN